MNKRIVLLMLLMFAIAGFGIATALGDHAQEEGNVLTIAPNGSEVLIAWSDLTTGPVQGTLLNGRGETTQINSEGIALQSLLDAAEVEAQEKVTLIAADGYQAEISAEELAEANRVWLILSDDGFRLIVFGDRDSKQALRNQALAILMAEIQKGRDSVHSQNDWVSEAEMLSHFGVEL